MAMSIRWPAAGALELPAGGAKKNLRVPHGLYNVGLVTEVH
jgi:hypothetical protein